MAEHATTIDLEGRSRQFAGGLPWEDEPEHDHIAGVAHDFNNLLSVILVCASEIAAGAEGAQRERAEEIREAARHGAELSRSLLGGSRTPAATAEVSATPARLDVREALAGARRLIERALGDGIRLALDAGAGLPPIPIAAADLERVLLNLAGNAREAMPSGGAVAIGAELVTIPPGDARLGTGWHVRIAFADNGCGMSADVAERALEPYFSTKDGAGSGGSGLGLASARTIIVAAGGDLRINSRPGAGTTIAIYLPALDDAGNRLALSPPAA
jgi:signal transduction histidine kinase